MKFLEKLSGRKATKAADLELTIAEIEAEIADTEGRLATLKTALASAPFERSPAEVRALRERVRQLGDDIEFARSVLAETERRRDAAREAEAKAGKVATFTKPGRVGPSGAWRLLREIRPPALR